MTDDQKRSIRHLYYEYMKAIRYAGYLYGHPGSPEPKPGDMPPEMAAHQEKIVSAWLNLEDACGGPVSEQDEYERPYQ